MSFDEGLIVLDVKVPGSAMAWSKAALAQRSSNSA
jgi:hypothetical protein